MATKIVSIAGVFLLVPSVATAQVVISELMYDLAEGSDSGREWVEVYNESGSSIDLTQWKFFEGTTNHGITATAAGELPAGAYAVIADNPAKFKADWPNFSGLLFDSAFSLNNTGESLGLRCCGKELTDKDMISYSSESGGAGDGASLSRSGSLFVPTDPTPGGSPGSARTVSEPAPKSEPTPVKLPEPAPAKSEPQPTPAPAQTALAVQEDVPQESAGTPLPVATKKKSAPKPQPVVDEEEIAEEEPENSAQENKSVSQPAAAATSGSEDAPWMWWAGAFGIAIFGAGGAYLIGRRHSREWTIIEETGEDV